MKPETEIKWIAKIFCSNHTKKFITKNNKPLNISGYERLCKAPLNDKIFNEWFKSQINNAVFQYIEIFVNNKKIKGYVAIKSKLIILAQSNKLYNEHYQLFDDIITSESAIKI